MTAGVHNFVIEQNATFKRTMTYKDASKKPVNLTGYDAHMQIRDGSNVVVADLTVQNGGIILGGAAGTIQLIITEEETTTMNFAPALYDLKIIAPDGTSTRLLQGSVTLSLGQTI